MTAAHPVAPADRGPGPQAAAARGDRRRHAGSRGVSHRLGALDASFLHLETPTTAMHVGAVATFAIPAGQPAGRDYYPLLVQRIGERVGAAPRYRQKLRWVGPFLPPVWVDDPDFDVRHHLVRHTLRAPGCDADLAELAARIQSRQLDRRRPLWELHLVEGLSAHRFALIIKIHHALVDGIGGLDLGLLFFDAVPPGGTTPITVAAGGGGRGAAPAAPLPARIPPARPRPADRRVSTLGLLADGLADIASRPAGALAALPTDPTSLRAAVVETVRRVGGLPAAVDAVLRPARRSPLNTVIGAPRQLAVVRTRLADHQRARSSHGGTINDVVLATVAGALRDWLHQRGEPAPATLRALIPVNRRTPARAGASGNHVSAHLVDLPVGDPVPGRRLRQVSSELHRHKTARHPSPTDMLIALAGWVPPALHGYATRAVGRLSRHLFNLVITNVPGPGTPLHVAGARLLTLHPVVPLAHGQALSIGVLSYDGSLFYGLTADRESLPDLDRLAALLEPSLHQLVQTADRTAPTPLMP